MSQETVLSTEKESALETAYETTQESQTHNDPLQVHVQYPRGGVSAEAQHQCEVLLAQRVRVVHSPLNQHLKERDRERERSYFGLIGVECVNQRQTLTQEESR